MDISKLSAADYYAQVLFSNGGQKANDYDNCLDAVRPIFAFPEWKKHVTGFFVNASSFDTNDPDIAVRITYFTTSSTDPFPELVEWAKKHQLKYRVNNPPDKTDTLSKTYGGGNELRLRKFCARYTIIALDIMKGKENLLHARCLCATFRWQVRFRGKQAVRPHFEPTFERESLFYGSMLPDEKKEFWEDLSSELDWAHLFVNMVLIDDPLNRPNDDAFLRRFRSLTSEQPYDIINADLNRIGLGFQIHKDWSPDAK